MQEGIMMKRGVSDGRAYKCSANESPRFPPHAPGLLLRIMKAGRADQKSGGGHGNPQDRWSGNTCPWGSGVAGEVGSMQRS